MQWLERIKRLPPLVWLPLLLAIFFNKMAFSNLILARGDTFLYFYPYWEVAADALRNGRIPLWNPHLFMGAPFLANSQVGFFYPLNWPVWLLLPTPYAVSVSILLHLLIAGMGAYLAGRRALGLGRWAGLVTAVLFALGGYLTAQVEHINQLQGLAWMPWFLWVAARVFRSKLDNRWVLVGQGAVGFALLFSLQLLAGHTQTSFITGIMLIVWGVAHWLEKWLLRNSPHGLGLAFQWRRFYRRLPLVLLMGGGVAVLLTAVQLLPTFELIQQSSRQGGLTPNEVLSFSLHPLLLNRALLPAYGQSLFSEYVAILPLTALLLAFLAAWQWRQWRGVVPAIALVLLGLLLALGIFNPLNWLLARLPGFNLFRVPARWLAVYGLGVAMLAGLGWQMVLDRWLVRRGDWRSLPMRVKENLWHLERPFRYGIWLLIGLIGWNVIAQLVAIFVPTGPEAPFEAVGPGTLLVWLLELALLFGLILGQRLVYAPEHRFRFKLEMRQPGSPWLLLPLMLIPLFWGTRTHPYNSLTTPEAYFDLRPPLARLMAESSCAEPAEECNMPPDRFLSLSDIFFDVGDQAEIDTIYANQLSPEAQYDYTIAIKQKEIIGPNLPMSFGLATVDGFDGGILPLNSYSQFVQLVLPTETRTTDGRLREHLTAVPPDAWLDLTNGRYLITDKVGDVWQEVSFGRTVFFDLEFPITLGVGESLEIAYLPTFEATAIAFVSEGEPGWVEMETEAGEVWELTAFAVGSGVVRADWPPRTTMRQIAREAAPSRLVLHGPEQGIWQIHGATLINMIKDGFQPLTLGNYRLIHSGDVKIYENLDVLPRAFLLSNWSWQPEQTAVLQTMQQPEFNVRETAVLLGNSENQMQASDPDATAKITRYEPERIEVQTSSSRPQLLVLTDAYYPGWQVTVDGESAELLQANGLFRGVLLPVGEHKVTFTFAPRSFQLGGMMTAVGLILLAFLGMALLMMQRLDSR
ncbi:YfhO family protein [Candidatus Leptofilum sp.]|uniref:YfhO family protein n=1 Tax=Candidatus Leptofilum sp. TaxID=3241576 RepID=UPI003B5B4645